MVVAQPNCLLRIQAARCACFAGGQQANYNGEGIAVASIAHGSAVRGPKGLKVGDAIVAVNDCPVKNVFDWRNCLARSIMQPTTSVCMKRELVARLNESAIGLKQAVASPSEVVDCCDSSKASSNLCFVGESFEAGDWKGHACLPVRNVLEQSRSRCNATALCGEDSFCMRPSLGNSSRLLQVTSSQNRILKYCFILDCVHNTTCKNPLLFVDATVEWRQAGLPLRR